MLAEFTGLSALDELAARVQRAEFPVVDHWADVGVWFREWAGRPDLRRELRAYIDGLTPQQATWVIAHSRETTTHFAWCLRDEPDEPFTFWLHEYKPFADWRAGYADSVHNHRYHFCTTILKGAYLHERYAAAIKPDNGLIASTTLLGATAATASSGSGYGTSSGATPRIRVAAHSSTPPRLPPGRCRLGTWMRSPARWSARALERSSWACRVASVSWAINRWVLLPIYVAGFYGGMIVIDLLTYPLLERWRAWLRPRGAYSSFTNAAKRR